MHFWVTIDGDIGTEGGESLWGHINKYAGVNLTQLFDVAYVHGEATPHVLRDILYQCSLTGHRIQLNTTETPSK